MGCAGNVVQSDPSTWTQSACESSGFATFGAPVANVLMILVPVIILVVTLHKVAEHRESAGAFLIEALVKAAAGFAFVLLVRTVFGV